MKKILKLLIITIVALLVFNDNVYADIGPKPTIDVIVENAKSTDYELDLLVYRDDWEEYIKEMDQEQYNKLSEVQKQLYNYDDNNWKAGSLHITTLWKYRETDHKWNFSYLGVPTDFKVIIMYADGETRVSEEMHRNTFDMTIKVDANTMKTKSSSSNGRMIRYNLIVFFLSNPLLLLVLFILIIAVIALIVKKKKSRY